MKRKAVSKEGSSSFEAPGASPDTTSLLLAGNYDGSFDAVFLIDREGSILESGGAASQMFGVNPEEAVGLPIERFLTPPRPEAQERARTGPSAVDRFPYEARNLKLTARRASGTAFPVQVNIARGDGSRAAFVAFVRDASRLADADERRERAERELEQAQEDLRTLAVQLPLDVESERRRIARGLHDQVGNALAIARMRLGELRNGSLDAQALSALEEAERETAKAMQEIRTLTFELSSPVLYELGLEAALKSLGKRLGERHEIEFEFSSDARPKPLSEDRQVILYRIIEELLVNIVKHAWASTARISVDRVEGEIHIAVEDDGVGLEPDEKKLPGPDGGFGLFGVRQRLGHIDGALAIEAAFPSGTRVLVSAPLEPERD